jgi:hypothetical protein
MSWEKVFQLWREISGNDLLQSSSDTPKNTKSQFELIDEFQKLRKKSLGIDSLQGEAHK